MHRQVLSEERVHPAIREQLAARNREIVEEVEQAIAAHDVVIVGMKTNPHPKRAGAALKKAGIAYKYLEYGSYMGPWRKRNTLKMWSGWPTLPMVFVKGVLVGGANETLALLANGELHKMLQT